MVAEQSVSLAEQYAELRPRYEKLCDETKRIIVESFEESGIYFQNISSRAKNVESFLKKAGKFNGDSKKYNLPLSEITDLAGVRIITYTLKDLEKVDRFIVGNFDIVEKRDVGEERYKEGKFGYQSIHYLVQFPENRLALAENKKYSGLICEIQIRTVLQHAWAEIEHDIQYKNQSDVPRSLERKFIALAGLLEIADREFQAIQDEDARLKKTIDEQLQNEVTRANISKNLSDSDEPVAVLVRSKRYAEAILLYNDKITLSPNMHTLYLGRARAKFLSGDRQGALSDIDLALELAPSDAAAQRLREQFIEGALAENIVGDFSSEYEDPNALTRQANMFIESGDGVSAFELYSKAQDNGASRPFSQVNKAISCYVSLDYTGALYFLNSLQARSGTPMSVTIAAMHCLITASIDRSRFEGELEKLENALNEVDDFTLSVSPLAKLRRCIESGHMKLSNDVDELIEVVFSKIEGKNDK